jgi:hypothetical protein
MSGSLLDAGKSIEVTNIAQGPCLDDVQHERKATTLEIEDGVGEEKTNIPCFLIWISSMPTFSSTSLLTNPKTYGIRTDWAQSNTHSPKGGQKCGNDFVNRDVVCNRNISGLACVMEGLRHAGHLQPWAVAEKYIRTSDNILIERNWTRVYQALRAARLTAPDSFHTQDLTNTRVSRKPKFLTPAKAKQLQAETLKPSLQTYSSFLLIFIIAAQKNLLNGH